MYAWDQTEGAAKSDEDSKISLIKRSTRVVLCAGNGGHHQKVLAGGCCRAQAILLVSERKIVVEHIARHPKCAPRLRRLLSRLVAALGSFSGETQS